MTQRKKPQQQLASYFDELLTELEEPNQKASTPSQPLPASSVPVVKQTHAKPSKGYSVSSSPTGTHAIANDTPPQSADSDSVSPPRERVSHEQSVSASSSAPTSTVTATPTARPTSNPPQALTSEYKNTAASAESQLDLREREKVRLEKLLQSLTPIPAITTEPTEDHIASKIETVATVSQAPLSPSPNTSDTLSSLTDQKITASEVTELITASDALVESLAANEHQWQPVNHEWQSNGRPVWADAPFDVLLVTINGMQLAMPLVALDAINPLNEALTPLFGQAKWFMGLQKTITGNVNVINTAQFIMPERYHEEQQQPAKYSVAINGSGWALAVDDLQQPITIDPADIRWRKRRSERPWMAGTVKDHVCALIDIPTLANMLKTSDKNQSLRDKF